jgi:hypothetical protein
MKIFRLTAVIVALIANGAFPAGAAEGTKAWVLSQTSSVYGRMTTYVTANSLRVDLNSSESYLVATAPNWRVVLYSPADKVGFDMDFEQYLKHSLKNTFLSESKTRTSVLWPKVRAGTMTYANMQCSKFVLPMDPKAQVAEPSRIFGYFLILERPRVPKQACQILAKLFFQPPLPGIPMTENVWPDKSRKSNSFLDFRGNYSILSTTNVEEKTVQTVLFKYPVNFKKVTREVEVLAGSSRRKGLDEVFSELRVGQ